MRVEQLNEGMWAMTYLVVCEETSKAALIDPVWDNISDYVTLLEEDNLELQYAIATHTHADHITGCFTLAEMLGVDYVMWNDTPSLGVSIYVDEETSLSMGSLDFHFHHAPGHTSDSMIIECGPYIFTGDFLFTGDGGVGRDDLPSGRTHIHWQALDVLNRFDSDVLVCTGHDPPGTEMQKLSWNRKNNLILNLETYEEYSKWQDETSSELGHVSKIKIALPANLFAEIPEEIPWID
ncbi:MAG: MBL fold metallo-hydrolase [Candidatus Poseidoniaceae archaeon]|jgi:glyoxylase-like metal-dependent hydrolase (beta-lactamase superfamily II)|nr:MBL fold metallo-hydrolase [Candidatus Poseidoniaceae archaeon]